MFTRRHLTALLFTAIAAGNVQANEDANKADFISAADALARQSVLQNNQQVAEELSSAVLHDVHTASHRFETDADAENKALMAEVTIRSYEPPKKVANTDA